MKRLSLALAALVALPGCSLLPYGPQVEAIIDQGVEQSIIDRKKHNDDKRDLILEAGCDISLGAAGRMEDKVRQFYLLQHCGINAAVPEVRVVPTP
jgi:hypothetical protein